MKMLCANCGERPASFIRRKIGLKVKHDKDHNLCRQCFESMKDSVIAARRKVL